MKRKTQNDSLGRPDPEDNLLPFRFAPQKPDSVKAWAIVNNETGRLMLIDVCFDPASARMESPAIYMTRLAAKHHKNDHERIVRVIITELIHSV